MIAAYGQAFFGLLSSLPWDIWLGQSLGTTVNPRIKNHGNPRVSAVFETIWLGWQGSNLRMPVPKTGALPLGYTPAVRAPIAVRARM